LLRQQKQLAVEGTGPAQPFPSSPYGTPVTSPNPNGAYPPGAYASALPQPVEGEACDVVDGSLNCHGYGSSVTVTATFGLCAAAELQRLHLARVRS